MLYPLIPRMIHSKKIAIFLGLLLADLIPQLGFCVDWDRLDLVVNKSPTRVTTLQDIRDHLSLLTSPANIQDQGDRIVIAGGFIVMDQTAIRSYRSVADFNADQEEHRILLNPDHLESALADRAGGQPLSGIRIALDIIPSHKFYDNLPFGDLSYLQFVDTLQTQIQQDLANQGAAVSLMRSKNQTNLTTGVDALNAALPLPPHILLSTQFNNDHQDGMVTFCGGFLSQNDFNRDTQRARFIHAALTKKHICSAQLGACISQACHEPGNLGVQLLAPSYGNFTFEGNADPIPTTVPLVPAQLEHEGNFYVGISTRNLAHNGVYAGAVVIPFPDMQWVQKQVTPDPQAWIHRYVQALGTAVNTYVAAHPNYF